MNIKKLLLRNMTQPFDKRKSVSDIENDVAIAKIVRPLRELHRRITVEVQVELANKKTFNQSFA